MPNGDGRNVQSIATRKSRRIVPRSFRDRLLINVSPVGTLFDTYFGRYKDLFQRSAKSIPIPSLPPSSSPFKQLQFTALSPAQQIEFYHLQAALITILASSYFPISCQTSHRSIFRHIMLIADHYLNCVKYTAHL